MKPSSIARLNGQHVGQAARRFVQAIGVDAALIGVDRVRAAEVVLGGERRAVELESTTSAAARWRAARSTTSR